MDRIASATTEVTAPVDRVWKALTDPADIKRYMFGTTAKSDWRVGSPITFEGEWQGKTYLDKGVITAFEPNRRLQYTHFSTLAGKPDVPENYHTVTVRLEPMGDRTRITLDQDNNETEEARVQSEKNWRMMLDGLRQLLEARPSVKR